MDTVPGILRVYSSEKDEDTMIDSKYTDSLNVIQIDLDVDELIQKMKNYKFSYNAIYKFSMDKNKRWMPLLRILKH